MDNITGLYGLSSESLNDNMSSAIGPWSDNGTYNYPSWQTTTILPNGSDVQNNLSTTISIAETRTPNVAIQILLRIHLVANPVIAILGTIGNLLAFFTFVSKPLRRTSCSLYLAARSLSDTGFLVSMFTMWIGDATPYQLYHRSGVCQTVLFLTYFCGFLSVWLVVLITVENYIRICHPFSVARFCTVPKATGFIIGLSVTGVLLYNFPLWIVKVFEHSNGQRYCNYRQDFVAITRMFTFGDLVLTLVIPSIAIILFMIGITYSLITSLKRQKRLKQKSERVKSQHKNEKKSTRSSSSPQAKVTKMLFAVSFIFLLLNLPSHAVRLRVLLMTYQQEVQQPTVDEMLQVIFQVLYYMSFAVNLVVYLVCGDNFRKVFADNYISCFLHSKYMRRKSEVSHTSFTTIRMDAAEPMKEEETSLIA